MHISIHHPSIHPSIHRSIDPSIDPSVRQSVHPSIHLSAYIAAVCDLPADLESNPPYCTVRPSHIIVRKVSGIHRLTLPTYSRSWEGESTLCPGILLHPPHPH